jgi:hypothetical protein
VQELERAGVSLYRKPLTDDRPVRRAGRLRWGMTQPKARERRAALLREFEICGLSLAEFCRRAGLACSTVLGWRRRAREEEVPASQGFVVVEALPAERLSEKFVAA